MAALNMQQTSMPVMAPRCTPTPTRRRVYWSMTTSTPIGPQHDGLAAKQVDAPQAVGGMSDERQPRGPSSTRGRAIVFRQHAVHDVLVDVDPERLADDADNPWTAEARIARLEFDDGLDKCLVRPFRSGLLGTASMRTDDGTCDAPTPDETPTSS